MADNKITDLFDMVALKQDDERVVHTITKKAMAGQLGVEEVTLHAFDGLTMQLTRPHDMPYYEFAHVVLESFENIVAAWEEHYDYDV